MPRAVAFRSWGLKAFAGLAAALSLAGCSTVGVLNTVEPKFGLRIQKDIAFGTEARRRLDVYAPSRPRPGAPVVVFFYGGGWDSGAKGDYVFVGSALASKGYVVVIPDYRLYPQARYPVFLQDCAAAVRWAKDHAADYGADPQAMVLMGHSAGAYNAAMLAIDPRWLEQVGLDPHRDVRAMVGLAGPYDFLPLHSDELRTIFGPADQRPQTQPINHVGPGLAPMWLGTDLKDRVVDPGNTTRLATKVRAVGGSVEVREYARLNHALMIGVVAAPLRFLAPVFKDLTGFIDAQIGGSAQGRARS